MIINVIGIRLVYLFPKGPRLTIRLHELVGSPDIRNTLILLAGRYGTPEIENVKK